MWDYYRTVRGAEAEYKNKEYTQALEYYTDAVKMAKTEGISVGITVIFNIGNCHYKLNNYETALTYFKEAKHDAEIAHNQSNKFPFNSKGYDSKIRTVCLRLIEIAIHNNDLALAINYYLELFEECPNYVKKSDAKRFNELIDEISRNTKNLLNFKKVDPDKYENTITKRRESRKRIDYSKEEQKEFDKYMSSGMKHYNWGCMCRSKTASFTLKIDENGGRHVENNKIQKIDIKQRVKRNQRFEEAIEFLQKAHEICPDKTGPLKFLGRSYEHLGNLDKALEFYEKCVEIRAEPQVKNLILKIKGM